MKKSEAIKDVCISTEIALLQKIAAVRGIDLFDFKRLHDEGLTYINSIKNGYADCSVKIHVEYSDFLSCWDGSLTLISQHLREANKYFVDLKEKLTNFISENTSLLEKFMDDMGDFREDSFVVDSEYRDYVNSPYSHNKIKLTVGEWFNTKLVAVEKTLASINEKLAMTNEELLNKYSFTTENVQFVSSLFKGYAAKNLDEALKHVSGALITQSQERAYLHIVCGLMYNYISGLDMKYWYTAAQNVAKNYKTRR